MATAMVLKVWSWTSSIHFLRHESEMQILKSHPRSTASEILGGAGTGIYVLAGPLQAILV